MPFVIKFNGAEKLALLCCVCRANHRARMNFGRNVNMYNNLKREEENLCEKVLKKMTEISANRMLMRKIPEFKHSGSMIQHEIMASLTQ